MVEEAYVSFETAKLLKGKWFDEKCLMAYIDGELFNYYDSDFPSEYELENDGSEVIDAPTQQMAMRWLREVHNIQIELNWDKGNQLYNFSIWKPDKYQPEISSLDLWRIYKDDNYLGEWNYEEACETAIKYCLENLI